MLRKTLIIAALSAAGFTLTACAAQDPPKEVQVELEDGRTASCIVVNDSQSGDVEEMVCHWPGQPAKDTK